MRIRISEAAFFTGSGMLRLRWWLPLVAATISVAYLGLNLVTIGLVAFGIEGRPDPFWHAPLFWLFG